MAMTTPAPSDVTVARTIPYLEWGPIFAGAIAAAAISFLLLSFGAAVGLTLTSPWPNTGARLWVVALAVAWFALAVQIASFAAGGYLAGRMRRPWVELVGEGEFRDNVHGLMVWAVGVLFGALLLGLTSGAALRTATQSVATVAGGAASGAANAAVLSTAPADYATDLLLRSEGGAPSKSSSADDTRATRFERPGGSCRSGPHLYGHHPQPGIFGARSRLPGARCPEPHRTAGNGSPAPRRCRRE